jgi:hypothetical protein
MHFHFVPAFQYTDRSWGALQSVSKCKFMFQATRSASLTTFQAFAFLSVKYWSMGARISEYLA